jgi:5-methyltetrahydropteroyltriglutamate--homocysteine methyltransferase
MRGRAEAVADATIRAENVGSLLRPHHLLAAQRTFAAGEMTAAEFKAIEDAAIDDAIELQQRAGIGIVTDGELRRNVFASGLVQDSDGFEVGVEGNSVDWFRLDGAVEPSPVTVAVGGRIERRRLLSTEEFTYLRRRAGNSRTKVSIPSPTMFAYYWYPPVSRRAYASPDAFLEHVTELLSHEAESLVRLGCDYIQIDAPELGMLLDPHQRRWFEAKGFEAESLFELGNDLINRVLESCGPVTTALHVCRGNDANRYMARDGYEELAERIFPRTKANVLLLEYDDDRSGGFDALRRVPDDKLVVLGLVSTKRAELERREQVRERIEEAARVFDRERLALSTQCGFASVARGNDLAEEVEEQKLRLVADVASEVWA